MIAHMISIDSRRGIRHVPDSGFCFRPPEAKGFMVCHILGGADQERPATAKGGQEQALFPSRSDGMKFPSASKPAQMESFCLFVISARLRDVRVEPPHV